MTDETIQAGRAAAVTKTPMLRVSGLSKSFQWGEGRVGAVENVSFTVGSGEFFTLLGPSGSGKSTTLRCIAGLEVPESGEIVIGDQVAFSSTDHRRVPAEKRDIAMVFQSYAIWPHMSVAQNVEFPLRVQQIDSKERLKRVDEALELVGLGGLARRSATALSGGQQQRVALARALVKGSSLILLDEPLSNLDAKLRVEMRYELAELQRRLGVTMVYVTHDQEEALVLSDRIAVMNLGAIEQLGNSKEIYFAPRTKFVATFIGQTNFVTGNIIGQQGNETMVRTSIGDVVVRSEADVHEGDPASLGIRPEDIVVLPSDEGAANTVTGKILEVFFSGRYGEYKVQIGDAILRVQGPPRLSVSEGDVVTLALPPDRCILVVEN